MVQDNLISELFGQRVRQLRMERGLSQEAFAVCCGMDRTYISSLERGHRNVCLHNIAAIAAALGVSLSELFEGVSTDVDSRR